MDFKALFAFLRELNENNSKEWMDENRRRYREIRDAYITWLNHLDIKLAEVDPDYSPTTGKQAINRINNNLMFHPEKPIYKDHFGAGLDKEKGKGDFYIHLGINECFVAGGFYKPRKTTLDSIRAAIDYNGEELKKILNKPSFKKTFKGLMEVEKLKSAPKTYSKDHLHIDLLRHKSFAEKHELTEEEILHENFEQKLIEVYREMLPFRRYLNKPVSV